MEPLYKLNSGNRVNLEDKKIFVEDATGLIGSTTYIEDIDNPGTYIPVNNTTGYGDNTKQRSAISLFLLAHIKKTTGNVPVSIAAYDPTTVSTFEINFVEDGWYEFVLIAVNNVPTPDPSAYLDGDVVYDLNLEQLVKLTAGAFLPIAAESLYDTDYAVAVSNKAVIPDAIIYKNKLNDKVNKLRFMHEEDTVEIRNLDEEYRRLRGMLVAANNQFRQGNHYIFQKHIEFITTNLC